MSKKTCDVSVLVAFAASLLFAASAFAQPICYVNRNFTLTPGVWPACAIEDLDGDGIEDFALAAENERIPEYPAAYGRVHIYSGRTGAYLRSVYSPNVFPGYSYTFADRIAGVPDVDGDGAGDLLVSARLETDVDGSFASGRAYLFSGATGAVLHTLRPDPARGPMYFSAELAAVGDVDGDGRGDVAIAEDGFGPGPVYVFSGATGEVIHLIEPTTFWGPPTVGVTFGDELSGVPDVDGDGVGDIVIRYAAQWGNSTSPRGRITLYSGMSGDFLFGIVPTDDVEVFGGLCVQGVPDMNGDGRGDIVVHVLLDAIPGQVYARRHRVHFYSGATGELFRVLASPASDAELGNSSFGQQFTWCPDADADGVPDIAISAAAETPVPGGWYNGQVYLYSGATGQIIRRYRSPNPPVQEGYFGAGSVAMLGPHGRPQFLFSAARERPTCGARLFRACLADWNWDGFIDSRDFFDFLPPFFAVEPSADYNLDGFINSQDFFDYLAAFFAGCG
ncbi:MAG: GC-type dockerin domain-anchored protein [Phycisphaerales bacterium]